MTIEIPNRDAPSAPALSLAPTTAIDRGRSRRVIIAA